MFHTCSGNFTIFSWKFVLLMDQWIAMVLFFFVFRRFYLENDWLEHNFYKFVIICVLWKIMERKYRQCVESLDWNSVFVLFLKVEKRETTWNIRKWAFKNQVFKNQCFKNQFSQLELSGSIFSRFYFISIIKSQPDSSWAFNWISGKHLDRSRFYWNRVRDKTTNHTITFHF